MMMTRLTTRSSRKPTMLAGFDAGVVEVVVAVVCAWSGVVSVGVGKMTAGLVGGTPFA